MRTRIDTQNLAAGLQARAQKIADDSAHKYTARLAHGLRAYDPAFKVSTGTDEVRISARGLRQHWVNDPVLRDMKEHGK